MKSTLLLTALGIVGSALLALGAELNDEQTVARKVALDVAGAFSNEGFKIRDGLWLGQLQMGKSQIVQVNLYAGNEYWFSVGASSQARKVLVTVYDEAGQPVPVEPYAEGATAAAGFAPDASGPYLVKVEELEGEPATFCLLYSYK